MESHASLLHKSETSLEEPTVFVVDDDPDVRRTITLLARSVELNVETFSTAAAFMERYDASRPGCLVLDIRMPGMTGLELQKHLAEQQIQLPIIFITAHGEIPAATAAMRAGAVDFIPKPFGSQALLESIHEALSIDQQRRELLAQRRQVNRRIATLTDREREIMHLLAMGESTKVVAKCLRISPKTVDNHRARILEKMEVSNATQLANLLACLD